MTQLSAPISPLPLPMIELRGVAIHALTEAQAVEHILDQLDAGAGGFVVTPNLDHLRRYGRDPAFRSLYEGASLVLADGMPVIWASRLQRTPLPERVPGSSVISTLSAGAARRSKSIFLLGGDEGTAEEAAGVLQARNPGLKVAGTYFPPMGFENDPEQMQRLVEALQLARPDVVFVALGSPKQERLIAQIHGVLSQAWWLGIGISFSFLCGRVKRAPGWMQKLGLEWVHRLAQEPKRLFRRYLIEGVPFALILLIGSAWCGLTRKRDR